VLAGLAACGGDGGDAGLDRSGSSEVDGPAVTFAEAPDTYAITYRVSTLAGDEVTVSSERVVADRPFGSRVELESADDEIVGRRVSRFGVLAVEGEGSARVLSVAPALGTSDVRPDAVLGEAVERGLAERRERREVGERPCQVYRLGSTASDGSLVPAGTTVDEYADLCVDARGLVLEEWWVRDGRPLRHRLAVDVDDAAPVAAAVLRLDAERSATAAATDGSVVASDQQPAFELDPPDDFGHVGRFDVTPAQLNPPGAAGGAAPPARTTIADVWTSDADFLVLDHGPGVIGPHPYAVAVDLAGLGPGELILDLRASEVRITLGDGSTVRLYGTLAPEVLLAMAATITPRAPAQSTAPGP
jgi:hypothetical protein